VLYYRHLLEKSCLPAGYFRYAAKVCSQFLISNSSHVVAPVTVPVVLLSLIAIPLSVYSNDRMTEAFTLVGW